MIASMTYELAWKPQRRAVADREQADVEEDVLQAVEKENHADEKQQVVVARHHVFRAEVEERGNRASLVGDDERGVALAHVVRERLGRKEQRKQKDGGQHSGQSTSSNRHLRASKETDG
jgi:hypothetical protein